MTKSILLDAALEYGRGGIEIFPAHGITDGRCTCNKPECASPGKHPWTPRGFKDATSNIERIEMWWTKHPNANIGAPTGHINGFVVIDVDPRHGGDESLIRLLESVGGLPKTVETATGGGGRHIFCTPPRTDLKNKAPIPGYEGVDFRGDGGYVILPPSLHMSGGTYEWIRPLLEADDE